MGMKVQKGMNERKSKNIRGFFWVQTEVEKEKIG